MTVATTWKPQYCDIMVNVISLDSTGIRTKCQSQTKPFKFWGLRNFDSCLRTFYIILLPAKSIYRDLLWLKVPVLKYIHSHNGCSTSYILPAPSPAKKTRPSAANHFTAGRRPPTNTTHAANCRKSETKVLYDRSNHVKASIQWRHVWCDFSGSY